MDNFNAFFFGIPGGKGDSTRRNCTLAISYHPRGHRSSRPMPMENYDKKSATRDVKTKREDEM